LLTGGRRAVHVLSDRLSSQINTQGMVGIQIGGWRKLNDRLRRV
jgi:hypothetical protein